MVFELGFDMRHKYHMIFGISPMLKYLLNDDHVLTCVCNSLVQVERRKLENGDKQFEYMSFSYINLLILIASYLVIFYYIVHPHKI